jgi:Trk K+ transport system NAD-binding subunit
MSDFVVFGLVIAVIITNLQRRYRPEQTCRVLAREAKEHAVVLHHTHLGQRAVELFHKRGVPVVVVDSEAERVAALIRDEQPVVIASGYDREDLHAASVARARLVIVAADGVEAPAVLCQRVRALNQHCALLSRCADEDVGAVLARAYRATVISTTALAAKHVDDYAQKHRLEAAIVVGTDALGRRVAAALTRRGIGCRVVDESPAKTGVDPATLVIGSPNDPATLERAGIRDADLVVLTDDDLGHDLVTAERIRDVNTRCRIVLRVFHEDAAAVLTQAPFRCDVVSTSRHAIERLMRDGGFTSVGIDRSARP